MKIEKYNDPSVLDRVRRSITEHLDREIGFDDVDASKGLSMVILPHNKKTYEVFVSDTKGWCDINKTEIMETIGLSNDKGFAKMLKSQTAEKVAEMVGAHFVVDEMVVYDMM